VFNPPYVETISEEVGEAQGNTERLIEKSWAGGANGMEVTDRLLEEIPELLSPQGIFYLVAVKENKPEEIIERMKSKGLTGEVSLNSRPLPRR
jgi:release factor glutamine methyltransferase